MPYIIDSITAQTITVDGNPVEGFTYYNNETSGSATTINWSEASVQTLILDNNPIITFTEGRVGQKMTLILKQTQPGVASVTWPNNVIWNNNVEPKLQSVGSGKIDQSFNIGSGPTDSGGHTWAVAIQNDDKIIVAGDYSKFNGSPMENLVRLNPDGSIDGSFRVVQGLTGSFNFGYDVIIQTDGKIICVGNFTQYNGTGRVNIVRINTDGSLDSTFNPGSGFSGDVYGVDLQSDNKIICTGNFTSYNGNSRARIVRINTDGSIDSTFSAGTGFNAVTTGGPNIQSDDKVVITGNFTTYNGTSVNRIVRLNTNGTIDNTFNVGTGFDSTAESAQIQSDGKIIVGGSFTTYNGTSSRGVVRINTDGTIDNTFNVGTGFTGSVSVIKLQSDGKLICVGNFTQYNGTLINTILRLNTDGSIDTSFDPGLGFNALSYGVNVQNDGKIIVSTLSKYYDNNLINGLVRIHGETVDAYNTINFEYDGTNYIGSY